MARSNQIVSLIFNKTILYSSLAIDIFLLGFLGHEPNVPKEQRVGTARVLQFHTWRAVRRWRPAPATAIP